MLRSRTIAFLLLCVLVCVSKAQTFYGPGGLIINPTAYTDSKGFFGFNASFFNRQTGGTTQSVYPASAVYAVDNRLEIGGLYIGEQTGSSHQNYGGFFAKYGLLTETKDRPAVAVVGTGVTGYGSIGTLTFVASKELIPNFHLHVGARGVDDSFESRADGNAFIGGDYQIARNFKLLAETDSRLRQFGQGSEAFGIQYAGAHIIATVGLINQAAGRYSFFVGVGYPVVKP